MAAHGEWAHVDPLRAAHEVLAQTSYLAGVPSPHSAGAEIDALAREMRAFDGRSAGGAGSSSSAEFYVHRPEALGCSSAPPASEVPPAVPSYSQPMAPPYAQQTPAATPYAPVTSSASPYATPAGIYGGYGAGTGGLLSAAQTAHMGGGPEVDSREAAAALRALQERVRGLEAERAHLLQSFEAQRANTLDLEQQLRRARLEQEERVASLVGSLDAARLEAARASNAQNAQVAALRRELDYVTQLAQAAEADRRVAAAQLAALESELAAQRDDVGEHAREVEQRTARLAEAAEETRGRAREVGARLAAERAERQSLRQQRGRVEDSLRRVLAMNQQLIDRVAHPPQSAPSSRPRVGSGAAAHGSAQLGGSSHGQQPAQQPSTPREPAQPSAHAAEHSSMPSSDSSAEPSPPTHRHDQRAPVLTPRSHAQSELARVLSLAEAELEAARTEYGGLVDKAYAQAQGGKEMPQAPILAALQRVEAKAAQLDSTRRALAVANEEITTARLALAKSTEVSEKRLRALHKLKPPEAQMQSTVRRLAAGHTAASAARSTQRPSSRGR